MYENYYEDFQNENKSSEINLQVGRKMLDFNMMPLFKDYVRKVFDKFKLDNRKLSDEQIENYIKKNQKMKTRLDIYIQLKYILAPIIEYVILLDRLVYLKEMDTEDKFENFIVKLFDPAISPRCHALISFNK